MVQPFVRTQKQVFAGVWAGLVTALLVIGAFGASTGILGLY